MRVLREFESHSFRQNSLSPHLNKPQKPALHIALAGFLLLKRYQAASMNLYFLLVNMLVYDIAQ
jgi:hypothetical protein